MILIVEIDPHCPAGFYGKLLRDWRVSHDLWRPHAGEEAPPRRLTGVIVLGGAMGVRDGATYPFLSRVKGLLKGVVAENLPCLGICLGGQLLAEALGATVHGGRNGEKGCHDLLLTAVGRKDPMFAGLPPTFPVFHWHNDSFEVPDGARHLATTATCPGQAFRYGNAWGVQFHPEVDGTIVQEWWRDSGCEPGLLAQFRRQQFSLHLAGEQLLNNFLGTVGAFQRRMDKHVRYASAR